MTDLEETGLREGWKVVTTIDNGTTRPYYDIVSVNGPDRAALDHVIEKARKGSKVHIEALRLVATSRMPTPKPKKGKR